MTNKTPDILEILNESRVFACLTQEQRFELSGKARIEHYGERTLLTQRGEAPDCIRYILRGGMDLVLSTADGGYSSAPLFEGRWSSWLGCFGAVPLMYDLWSTAPASYVAFSCRDIQKAIGDNPRALLEVIEHIAELTRFLTGWMLSFAAFGPEKRLVYLLLLASSRGCDIMHEGRLAPVTQTHISHFGFGSRQRVSRLLRGLADKGLIEMKYGGVAIPSRAKLEQYIATESPTAT